MHCSDLSRQGSLDCDLLSSVRHLDSNRVMLLSIAKLKTFMMLGMAERDPGKVPKRRAPKGSIMWDKISMQALACMG